MHKFLIISIALLFLFNNIFSQDCDDCEEYKENEIWITIKSKQNAFDKGNKLKFKNKKLDSTLNSLKVFELSQVFPYSKIDQLQRVYKLKFDCKRDSLISKIP